ncbi:TIGR03560 family F420-dependent LLM class oxidoreductase [Nocardioides koreensis]|uniref:TIGR03560 family F420-dependent LLM class oxidoreductase n=1 Tax=Nocardioides koreensis TaxID=433651 RepID=A0ABN2ZFB1_9ACTN
MRLGVHLVGFDAPGGPAGIAPMLAALGRATDEAGVDNLSLMDHYLGLEMLGDVHQPMLEGYTTLGFLAAHTSTVELQLLMTGVTYRHPGLLAKIVATLDVLSGGRTALGLGAAWYEREHLAHGVPFPSTSERFERLEETLRIVRQMWSDEDGPFEGTHHRLAETICAPQPLHRVPVMVGGNGERKTLRLVAAYADACNLVLGGDAPADEARHKFRVLRRHCEELGTDYDRIRRTVMLPRPLDPAHGADRFLEAMAELADAGVEEVHVVPLGAAAADPVRFVRDLGTHVVPHLTRV